MCVDPCPVCAYVNAYNHICLHAHWHFLFSLVFVFMCVRAVCVHTSHACTYTRTPVDIQGDKPPAKTNIVLDVKGWGEETDMAELEKVPS